MDPWVKPAGDNLGVRQRPGIEASAVLSPRVEVRGMRKINLSPVLNPAPY